MCNATASERGLKSDERMAFMAGCLRGDAEHTAREDRERMCNLQAGERQLKGAAREEFIEACLLRAEKLAAHQAERKRQSAAAGR